jgi:hypothetical protein
MDGVSRADGQGAAPQLGAAPIEQHQLGPTPA